MIVWISGKAGAGKTTLAKALIKEWGEHTLLIDGDELRREISKDLGFSREDREENALRALALAELYESWGKDVVVSLMESPYRHYVDCLIHLTDSRTHKEDYTGGEDTYREPLSPHLTDPTLEEVVEFIKEGV